jgi:hypothetical protein
VKGWDQGPQLLQVGLALSIFYRRKRRSREAKHLNVAHTARQPQIQEPSNPLLWRSTPPLSFPVASCLGCHVPFALLWSLCSGQGLATFCH